MHRHLDRVSEAYATERIREKTASIADERARRGLLDVEKELRASGVSPSTRLHLVSALIHLGRIADETRGSRSPPGPSRGPIGGP